jgi:hypothetical protein
MNEAIVRELAIKRSGQSPPRTADDEAISYLVPFEVVKPLLEGYPAPRRPNRNRPVNLDDPELREELRAWEAASDEAFEATEDGFPE